MIGKIQVNKRVFLTSVLVFFLILVTVFSVKYFWSDEVDISNAELISSAQKPFFVNEFITFAPNEKGDSAWRSHYLQPVV